MGFLLPAQDFAQSRLSLDSLLVVHASATFYFRAESNTMLRAGIGQGDLLIVDRALTPAHGSIVLAAFDGAFHIRKLVLRGDLAFLSVPESRIEPMPVEDMECVIWGVVTHAIKALHR